MTTQLGKKKIKAMGRKVNNHLYNPIILVDFINIFSNFQLIAVIINSW